MSDLVQIAIVFALSIAVLAGFFFGGAKALARWFSDIETRMKR